MTLSDVAKWTVFCAVFVCRTGVIWSKSSAEFHCCYHRSVGAIAQHQHAPVTCFKCDHVTQPSACNVTTKCNNDESCVVRKYQGLNGEYHSTGCIDQKKCKLTSKALPSPQYVGKRQDHDLPSSSNPYKRQADTLLCEKCCYGDKCNVLNCTISAPTNCVDKVSQCSNQVYRDAICQDDHNAILFCQKSCGKCPIDGGFSSWLSWSDCSVSCGGQGQTARVRTCDNPKPQNNGRTCQGQTVEVKTCDNGHCPVDGNWTPWGQWLPCNASCGGGTSMRIRSCSNPVPRYGGKPCANPASFLQTKLCNNQSCPIDGTWSPWSHWQPCNVSCGGGTTMRVRSCSDPVPRHGGKPCANPASFLQTKRCNDQLCPAIDGGFSSWLSWSDCSVSCGGQGQAVRVRICDNPKPQNHGRPCQGQTMELKTCDNGHCPGTIHANTSKEPPSTTMSHLHAFPTSSPTTLSTSTPVVIPASTPIPVTTSRIASNQLCQDQALCSDPHMKQIACDDLYLSKTFCPKMCHMCGPTATPPACTDMVGQKCQEQFFKQFTCTDPGLVGLCRRTCGLCHI